MDEGRRRAAPPGIVGEQRRRRRAAPLVGRRRAAAPAGRRRGIGSSSTTRVLGLARHPRLVGAGGDVAVGGAPPARVEVAVEARGARARAARLRRRPPTRVAGRASTRSTLTQPGRVGGERLEARDRRRRPSGVAAPVGGDVAVGVAGEEQPAERRVAAVPRARPPHDGLVLRAGQRDVGEAQVLAALLGVVLAPVVRRSRGRRADVDRTRSSSACGSWKKTGCGSSRDVARLPQERAVDDRELEALAAVDGQDLDRLGVGLQPPAALLVARVLARPSAIRCAQPARSARWRRAARSSPRRAAAGRRGAGRSAGARRRRVASTRAGRPSSSVIVSSSDATPRRAARRAQRAGGGGRSSQAASSAAATCSAVQPRNDVSAAGVRARGRGRPLERLEQPQPLARGRGGEHAAGAVDHRRDADARRARRGRARRCVCVRTSTAMWPGPDRLARRARAVLRRGSRSRRPRTSSATTSAARSSATCSRAPRC